MGKLSFDNVDIQKMNHQIAQERIDLTGNLRKDKTIHFSRFYRVNKSNLLNNRLIE